MYAYLRKRRKEKGSADIIVIMLTLPLIIFLIVSLIDVSLYFQARTQVHNATRDAVREAAIWGGVNSPLNPTGTTVTTSLKNKLWQDGRCTPGQCQKAPTVSCTPNRTTRAGQELRCTTTYYYRTISKTNPITGFGNLTSRSFTITETARSETGFR